MSSPGINSTLTVATAPGIETAVQKNITTVILVRPVSHETPSWVGKGNVDADPASLIMTPPCRATHQVSEV